MRMGGGIIRFGDGSFGRIIKMKARVVKRTSIHNIINDYIGFMYDKLLEWLEDGAFYDNLDGMIKDVEEYIYEELIEAPYHVTPCDNGVLSTAMFIDYVFNGVLWSDNDIADDLNGWVFEPEDLLDNMRVVACYEELIKLRDKLKSSIKVKIKGEVL
jgi:hypothetical protein